MRIEEYVPSREDNLNSTVSSINEEHSNGDNSAEGISQYINVPVGHVLMRRSIATQTDLNEAYGGRYPPNPPPGYTAPRQFQWTPTSNCPPFTLPWPQNFVGNASCVFPNVVQWPLPNMFVPVVPQFNSSTMPFQNPPPSMTQIHPYEALNLNMHSFGGYRF